VGQVCQAVLHTVTCLPKLLKALAEHWEVASAAVGQVDALRGSLLATLKIANECLGPNAVDAPPAHATCKELCELAGKALEEASHDCQPTWKQLHEIFVGQAEFQRVLATAPESVTGAGRRWVAVYKTALAGTPPTQLGVQGVPSEYSAGLF
jgi:hypothetical protein